MGKWSGWRKIEEFPEYQINSDGEIRKKESGRILKELQNKHTGAWYYQLNKNGRSYSRSYTPLLYAAWPELLEAWKPIPGFPGYLIDREGSIMGTIRWKELPMNRFEGYHLKKLGKSVTFKLIDFDWTVFNNYEDIIWYKKAKEQIYWRSIPGLNSHQINAMGHVRLKRYSNPVAVKEYFSVKHPGVLFFAYEGSNGKRKYMNYQEALAATWPEHVEKEAA